MDKVKAKSLWYLIVGVFVYNLDTVAAIFWFTMDFAWMMGDMPICVNLFSWLALVTGFLVCVIECRGLAKVQAVSILVTIAAFLWLVMNFFWLHEYKYCAQVAGCMAMGLVFVSLLIRPGFQAFISGRFSRFKS